MDKLFEDYTNQSLIFENEFKEINSILNTISEQQLQLSQKINDLVNNKIIKLKESITTNQMNLKEQIYHELNKPEKIKNISKMMNDLMTENEKLKRDIQELTKSKTSNTIPTSNIINTYSLRIPSPEPITSNSCILLDEIKKTHKIKKISKAGKVMYKDEEGHYYDIIEKDNNIYLSVQNN